MNHEHWNNLSEQSKLEVLMAVGWMTNKGNASAIAKRLSKLSWNELLPVHTRILSSYRPKSFAQERFKQ